MTCLKFTPDGQKIVTSSADNTLKIFEVRTGRLLFTLDDDILMLTQTCNKFAISPDGKMLMVGGS